MPRTNDSAKAPGTFEPVMGRRTSSRGRGFGNASPVTGLEAAADLVSKRVIRACETPEFYELHGCPHGRDRKKK